MQWIVLFNHYPAGKRYQNYLRALTSWIVVYAVDSTIQPLNYWGQLWNFINGASVHEAKAPLVTKTGDPLSWEKSVMMSPYECPSSSLRVGEGHLNVARNLWCSQELIHIPPRVTQDPNWAKSELVSTHNKNGIIKLNTRAQQWSPAFKLA